MAANFQRILSCCNISISSTWSIKRTTSIIKKNKQEFNHVFTQQDNINKSCLEVVWWRISDARCSDIDPEVEFG